jgi:shikimate kinase
MGSGKTTVGRLLADTLGWRFFDSDYQIRERTGSTGREIAAAEGVAALHGLEKDVFYEAIGSAEPAVVAAAASVVDDAGVRRALEDTLCVSLDADPEVLAERWHEGGARRRISGEEAPNLAARAAHFLTSADLTIRTDACSPEEAVDAILTGPLRPED